MPVREPLASVLVAVAALAGCGKAPEAPPTPTGGGEAAMAPAPATADRSVVELFATSCAACHGEGGKGDGPNAPMLDPRPRDFTTQALRFAATGGTREQMMAAVERTISRGLPHSGMPGFEAVMSTGEIAALAELVLARGGENNKESPPGTELRIPKPPEFTSALIERGKEAYLANICASCHGARGQADGAGAPGLTDMDGNPIRPADLSSPLHKSGTTRQDLYRAILMGVPGTPMAAYKPMVARSGPGGSVDDRDAWALVALIESFSPPSRPLPEPIVRAGAAAPGGLTDASAAGWFDVRAVPVMLHGTVTRPGVSATLDIRAARVGDDVLLRVSREDLPLDTAGVVVVPRDAAGAPLLSTADPLPAGHRAFKGAAGSAGAVVIRAEAVPADSVFQVILEGDEPGMTRFTGWIALASP